ncbi:MAG: ERCC4-type nuclease [Candidatus Bathyarchaeota archaeon]|nr:MAG: ERCC4-type nuclease [Candidatus Bathyarchaeota archaeon]
MKLFVDHRERKLAKLLKDVCEDASFIQLPIGDYLLVLDTGAVVVERKTVKDFLSSIRSNRLWDQLLRMMKTESVLGYDIKRKILVLHGSFESFLVQANHGIQDILFKHWSQLMGAYLEIIYVYNIPIIHAESDLALKAFLRILGKREASGKNEKLPDARWFRKPAKVDLPIKDRKKYILCALPYIGNQLAGNLLSSFETIADIACASIEDLQEVPKIGKKKAQLIYSLFH